MHELPKSLERHRVRGDDQRCVLDGHVRNAPAKSIWFSGMALVALLGGALTFCWSAFAAPLAVALENVRESFDGA